MDSIENLREQYYESIVLLQEKQDILDALPQPDYSNFFSLITGLIERIEKEMLSLKQVIEQPEQTDAEIKEYIEDEISTLLFKQEICKELLQRGKEDEMIEAESERVPKKNIIFATTNNGNVYVENDIKTLPEEYYESLLKMLQNLQNGIEENNSEKAKSMRTIDKKMSGIHSVKEFKIRLYYKRLSPDTVYVFMIQMKKSDNDALYRKEIINRASQINMQYEELKKQIKEPEIKEKLISENEQIMLDICEYLNKHKRGK